MLKINGLGCNVLYLLSYFNTSNVINQLKEMWEETRGRLFQYIYVINQPCWALIPKADIAVFQYIKC